MTLTYHFAWWHLGYLLATVIIWYLLDALVVEGDKSPRYIAPLWPLIPVFLGFILVLDLIDKWGSRHATTPSPEDRK